MFERKIASELDKLFNQNNEYFCIMYIFSVCSMIYLYTYETLTDMNDDNTMSSKKGFRIVENRIHF